MSTPNFYSGARGGGKGSGSPCDAAYPPVERYRKAKPGHTARERVTMTTDADGRLASDLCDQLGPLVEAAGMVNVLNHGSGSCVYSEGCHGVTQEHLERFAALLVAAERERCAKACESVASDLESAEEDALAMSIGAQSCADQIRAGA